MLSAGDLIITMTDLSKNSDTLGYPAIVPRDRGKHRFLHNQRIGKVTVKDERDIDSRFLYYLMCSKPYRDEILASASGTTVKHTSPDRVRRFSFNLPPLDQQRHIAHILSTLDDKINLNRRMNTTLETMVWALFKSWFMDFEPVRAKMEDRWHRGESLPGMPAELYDLFPDQMVTSQLGEVPEGWEVKALDEIAKFRNGLALQKFRPNDGEDGLPVVKIAQLRSGRANSGELASVDINPECIIDIGDVIFSWSGSLMTKIWCGGRAALNQHLFKVTSVKYPKWFYLNCVQHHLSEFQSIAADKTTTMGHIKRQHLSEAKSAVPCDKLIAAADIFITPLINQSILAQINSGTLETTRDTLLPRLIAGDLGEKCL